MFRLILLCIVTLSMSNAQGQVNLTSSNLPIVKITTDTAEIVVLEKIVAQLEIIDNGPEQRNNISDVANDYNGICGIKIRGESSSLFPKKSYAIEIWDENLQDIDTSLLGYPKEEDFILYGPYSDKSLINNVLVMQLARKMGQYASRTKFVELLIDEEYMGLYILMEKVKRAEGRVDISKLLQTDNEGDELTGGYILRIDKGQYDGWYSQYDNYGNVNKAYYQYYYPDQNDITAPQKTYIQNYIHAFEDAASSDNYRNDMGDHYTEYISLRSFVDHFIINELTKNADGYRLSTYFHKEKDSKGGRLHMGPIWDYNLSFGNADFCGTEFTENFLYYDCVGNSPAWWDNFLSDTTFTSALRCRYNELRTNVLHIDTLTAYISTLEIELAEAQARNFQKWDILGQYVWPNPDFFATALSHSEVIDILLEWLTNRLNWLDQNMPGLALDCEQYNDSDYEVAGLSDTESLDQHKTVIYPNPTYDELNISSEARLQQVDILDLTGKRLQTYDAAGHHVTLSITLPRGVYIVVIITDNGTLHRRMIVE